MAERFAVIGTAGHIDHGKTALVTALTGKNTDRLKEERERGISIDIDFAPLNFPDGTRLGLVDVPGHERFVHNMVAGAAGIDAALLVVDVQEGMMPQTWEHLDILQLLGVQHAVVALTKADLVDPAWVELAAEVVRESLASTPFAAAPLVATSVRSGQGLAELKQALWQLVQSLPPRQVTGAFRLPVDKVFSVPGHGTVVSGTVWRGQWALGDTLELLPGRRVVRVRGLQVHGQPVSEVRAGQRAALNLAGVERTEVRRGQALAAAGTLFESKLVDVRLNVLAGYERGLRHRERVHVHLATAAVTGRVLLLEADELAAGDSGFAQLLLERPLVCEPGDPFVLRSYSPVRTLGGGRVLDAVPGRLHRRKRAQVLAQLAARTQASPLARVVALAARGPVHTAAVCAELGATPAQAEAWLAAVAAQGELLRLPSAWYSTAAVTAALQKMQAALLAAHRRQRFAGWVARGPVAAAAGGGWSGRDVEWLLQEGMRRQYWELRGAEMRAYGHQVELNDEEQRLANGLRSALRAAGVAGIGERELVSRFPQRDRVAAQLLRWLQEQGEAVEGQPGWWMDGAALRAAVEQIRSLYERHGLFSAGQVRDELQVSRRVAVALLEYLDRCGLTRREGDVRRWMGPDTAQGAAGDKAREAVPRQKG
ncbi:MAG: selenocysteine-specific translation elongation factor [Alicyclobacillus sp.]|nr:selenocysteine-specific translation elongation factor [Alicyclobacillus sp.]